MQSNQQHKKNSHLKVGINFNIAMDIVDKEMEEEKIKNELAKDLYLDYQEYKKKQEQKQLEKKQENIKASLRDCLIGAGIGIITTGIILSIITLLGLIPVTFCITLGLVLVGGFSLTSMGAGYLTRYLMEENQKKTSADLAEIELNTDSSPTSPFTSTNGFINTILKKYGMDDNEKMIIENDLSEDTDTLNEEETLLLSEHLSKENNLFVSSSDNSMHLNMSS